MKFFWNEILLSHFRRTKLFSQRVACVAVVINLGYYRTAPCFILFIACEKAFQLGRRNVRESKKVLISGFYAVNCRIPGTGSRTLCHWNLDQPNSNS